MNNKVTSLTDIMDITNISENELIDVIDHFLPTSTINEIYQTVLDEFDLDYETESIDMSPDALISKMNDNQLKDIIKTTGIKVAGNESEDELRGMVKALAAVDESISSKVKTEATKLKRKKGIPHNSKFLK